MANLAGLDPIIESRIFLPKQGIKIISFLAAFVVSGLTLFVTILHYENKLTVNSTLWIFWLLSLFALLLAYFPSSSRIKDYWRYSNNKTEYLVFIFLAVLYFIIRVMPYKTSPLNDFGLWDDAAWDIYHANKWILGEGYFQASFLDTAISRESAFHYYIVALFELFGYNLFVFNMGLFFLGFITVLYTTLTVHLLFNRWWITLIAAFITLIFPLHVTQIIAGHRYSIAGPLIIISYYYLASGFKYKSAFQTCVGGIFIGLSLCGAPMGKQYLLALLMTIPLTIILFPQKNILTKTNFQLLCISFTSLIISLIPLFCYIHYNWVMFFNREKGILEAEWLQDYHTHGLAAIGPRFETFQHMMFSESMFMVFHPLIPTSYWLLLIPGMIITIYKRRWEIFIMCLLPAFICFLTIPYDFRIQISASFWIIAMLYTVNLLADLLQEKKYIIGWPCMLIALFSIGAGLASSTQIVKEVYSLPLYIDLGVKDVAFARVVQDIALENEPPTIDMKRDEFYPTVDINNINHHMLICPKKAFAVAHLYLQKLDEIQALSFCNGVSLDILANAESILTENLKALSKYKNDGKDLILVWQVDDNSKPIIELFRQFEYYGEIKNYHYRIDLDVASPDLDIVSLKINKENIDQFLNEAKLLQLNSSK